MPKLCGGKGGLVQIDSWISQIRPGTGSFEGKNLQQKSLQSLLWGTFRSQTDLREKTCVKQCLSPNPTQNRATKGSQSLQVGSEVPADDELPEFPERAAPLEGVASRFGRVHGGLGQAEGSYLQQRVTDGVLHREHHHNYYNHDYHNNNNDDDNQSQGISEGSKNAKLKELSDW